ALPGAWQPLLAVGRGSLLPRPGPRGQLPVHPRGPPIGDPAGLSFAHGRSEAAMTAAADHRDGVDEAVDALARDGAAVVRGVVPARWIERPRGAIDAEMTGVSPTAAEYGKAAGRFYGDFFLWLREPAFRDFALASPMPELAARLTRSSTATLLYDQLFVKE